MLPTRTLYRSKVNASLEEGEEERQRGSQEEKIVVDTCLDFALKIAPLETGSQQAGYDAFCCAIDDWSKNRTQE